MYTELELNDEWTRDVLFNVMFHQEESFMTQESWMNYIVKSPDIKTGLFSSLDQVRRFRDLGNKMYQALPNPYLKGWKPSELDNPPQFSDDLPENENEITDILRKCGALSTSPADIAHDKADLDMIQRYCEEFVRKKKSD